MKYEFSTSRLGQKPARETTHVGDVATIVGFTPPMVENLVTRLKSLMP